MEKTPVAELPIEKERSISHHEDMKQESAHQIAERGHVATDMYVLYQSLVKMDACLKGRKLTMYSYGHSLVEFDPKAEARLRLKIDLYIVPTVALLYLFCFIDRANIGMSY
jgi:hypothetical protein